MSCDTLHCKMKIVILCILHLFLASSAYVIDDSSGLGRTFDGLGGLSGGGATSKLLINYPEPQRSQVLDYLFKPNFGASLHILKVEIGGDSQSTEGTESSHMHNATDENYNRGYEWWLMKEAKARNPEIKLYGLPWAFPGWVGKGSNDPYKYPSTTAMYIIKWIQGAKKYHGLDIDYIGVWNERPYNVKYVEVLRSALNDNGFKNIKLVAADGGWEITGDIDKDNMFSNSVDIIGVHYPGTKSTSQAVKTTKPLWSSEDYSTFNDNVGAGCWARILNQNYVTGYMTSTISWNLIAAYYPNLPFGRCGLMTAQEPWSGNYVVENPIWVTAHTTQFTKPGMKYLKHGYGVGYLDNGGSYVSFVDPADTTKFTMVVETMSHDHSLCIRPNLPRYNVTEQTATFQLKGNLAKITSLNGRRTQLGFNGKSSDLFQRTFNVKVDSSGSFSLPLYVDMLITLSTVSVGNKGNYEDVPASKAFPLPFNDTFDTYALNTEAFDFVPQVGVWEVRNSSNGHRIPPPIPPRHNITFKNQVNTQVLTERPINWCGVPDIPICLGGNYNWSDIFISVDVTIPKNSTAQGAFIAARVDKGGCGVGTAKGVFFWLFPSKKMYAVSSDLLGHNILLSGPFDYFPGEPLSMSLVIYNNHVVGSLGQGTLFSMDIPKSVPANGFVGYGVSNFGIVEFDNVFIDKSVSSTY